MTSEDPRAAGAATPQSQRLEEEHHEIRHALEELEGTGDLERLAPLLVDLRSTLVEHFAFEEAQDGVHGMMTDTAPRFAPLVKELFDEHQRFLEQIDSITAEVERARQTILEQKTLLVEGLRRHEEKETEVFSQTVYSELGAGD